MSETTTQRRYALVIRLPRDVELQIEDAFLGHLGVTRSPMGYHVTLLGPFCMDEGWLGDLRRLVERVCRSQACFSLDLGGIGVFEAGSNYIAYLRVCPATVLGQLRHRIEEACGAQGLLVESCPSRSSDYVPHLTLALDMTEHELGLLRESSTSAVFRTTFVVDSLSLAMEEGEAPWRHIGEFALGSKSAIPQD